MDPLTAGALGLGFSNTAYNIFTNKRDFDYQKALQQTMFEREDTAVQRRMADLQAAGLNPNLAAGSAAGAGAVVSRSTTNDVNMGSALDTVNALQQIRLQRQQQNLNKQQEEMNKVQKQILENKSSQEFDNKVLSDINLMYNLGLPFIVRTIDNGNGFVPQIRLDYDKLNLNAGDYDWDPETFSPLLKFLKNQTKNDNNAADLLQRDLDWYTADKVSGMALSLFGLGNSASGWRKAIGK